MLRALLVVTVGLLSGTVVLGNEEEDAVEANVEIESAVPKRKVKVHQFMLPEKNTWHISKGKKKNMWRGTIRKLVCRITIRL